MRLNDYLALYAGPSVPAECVADAAPDGAGPCECDLCRMRRDDR